MLYLVVLPGFLLHLAFGGSRVILPLFALSLDASPFTVGVIMSLMGILPMMFAVSAGRIIDRIGVRRPMLLGACTVIAGLLVAVAVPLLEIMFLVSSLAGAGFVCFHIAVNYAAGMMGGPENRVKNFSVIALTWSSSGFLGPLVTGFAIDWIGYRHTFMLLAGSALLSLVALLVKKLEIPKHVSAGTHGETLRFTDLLRERTVRRVLIISSALSMAWDLFTFVVPIHGSRIGLTASQIGMILSAYGIGIFVARLMLPLFAHHLNEWKTLTTAMISAAVMFFVFPLVLTVTVLMFFAFILGIGLGGMQPLLMTLVYSHAPPGRAGEAIGLRTLLLTIGQSGMPLMFGALGAALGMTPVFWTMALALAGTGYWLRRP